MSGFDNWVEVNATWEQNHSSFFECKRSFRLRVSHQCMDSMSFSKKSVCYSSTLVPGRTCDEKNRHLAKSL